MTTYEFTMKTTVRDDNGTEDLATLFDQARRQFAVQLLDEDADFAVEKA